jgi:hypothetical protein
MGKTYVGTPGNVKLTPCKVKFNGVNVGFTSGGVSVKAKEEFSDITVDQLAKTIIDKINVGKTFSIKVPLTELTVENIKVAFPMSQVVTEGAKKVVIFGTNVGDSLLAKAALLNLHPQNLDDTDLSGDWTAWLAAATGESEITYGPEKQIVIEVNFVLFPDLSKPANQHFCVYGDPSVGVTDADAGTPVRTGTGNGTMGSIVISNEFTKSETWTATCIKKVTGGGLFSVSGSVTGSRGVATVGTAFKSNTLEPTKSEIGFTISAGATDFEEGDVFTVATTAAYIG